MRAETARIGQRPSILWCSGTI